MPTAPSNFTIHENQLAEALAQLSPDVERHRKGRGLRRERCVSYWDEDILEAGLQCEAMDVDGNGVKSGPGKQELDESGEAAELMRVKPFTSEAVPARIGLDA